jgi:hypothetical protein
MLNRLEIDVLQANELYEASHLTTKYKLPAMVVHQDLASQAYITRNQLGGKFKIITPVDWPKGNTFGMAKFRGLPTDALENDGFEILLTGGKNLTDTRNEAKEFTKFVKGHLSEMHEVRFVLNTLSRDDENIRAMCEALKDVRMPSFLRNDINLKPQIGKANVEKHNAFIAEVSAIFKAPFKISGNINNLESINNCQNASRFAVSLTQAKSIIKEFNETKR